MIKFTYYGGIDNDLEFEGEIEDGIITTQNMPYSEHDRMIDEFNKALGFSGY